MAESRSLRLRFILETSGPIGPDEFRTLFHLADEYATYIALREVRTLLRQLHLDEEVTERTVERMRALGQSGATVSSVQRGSWVIELELGALALVWLVGKVIEPVIKTAWDGSRARQVIEKAVQNVLFFGAKQEADDKRLATPQIGNMRVNNIVVSAPLESDTPALDIRVEPKIIYEPTRTEKQLIDDFLAKLQRRP